MKSKRDEALIELGDLIEHLQMTMNSFTLVQRENLVEHLHLATGYSYAWCSEAVDYYA